MAGATLLGLPVAVVLHEATLLSWHAPTLYEDALAAPSLHFLEHATFFATAVLFWAAVLSGFEGGSLRNPGALVALFLVSVAGNALGALFVFASSPWYETYAATAPTWGIDPLLDQRLAGGVMWMVGGLFYLAALLALVLNAMTALDRRQQLASEKENFATSKRPKLANAPDHG
jgi:cytochrome c oxidase assembly factor CtaG